MKVTSPRKDFILIEDYFTPLVARELLTLVLNLGKDRERGFHHPELKPNRFHKKPKYPVKKFMCLGLYWNPLDYKYYELLPGTQLSPHPIPELIKKISQSSLEKFYPTTKFFPESVMVNFYTKDSSMGLHVDKDEPNQLAPIIGINFGSTCRFFYEDEKRDICEVRIPGNSLYIFGGSARLMRHGVGTLYARTLSAGSEEFLLSKERLNLTIRQVYV